MTETLTCICGAKVFCDAEKRSIIHEGKECRDFREIVERNKRNPHVANPQRVSRSKEESEIDIIVSRAPIVMLMETAKEFGYAPRNAREAARIVLREMRSRGWKVNWLD